LPKTAQRFNIPGRTVHWFESVGSTMTVAAELAREGASHGTVVAADEQTAGIGRHGHSWHSQKGGLYVSIVLHFPRPLPVMMLALGLAARDAIALTTGLQPDLRWPNDVLLDGRKCAGVISQTESGAIVAGIGINVNQTAFPEGIDATSLLLAGVTTTREAVFANLLKAVDRYCAESPAEIRRMFEAASSYARGRRVRVEQGEFEGVTQGLDASGFLIVQRDNGQNATILAGGVRPCC
jgi:BirA family transcriptional regulator, biotin operon repressor / biotin---[acetyl-CoA-carboxylase] ligase